LRKEGLEWDTGGGGSLLAWVLEEKLNGRTKKGDSAALWEGVEWWLCTVIIVGFKDSAVTASRSGPGSCPESI
jgi:hypothetical protein